MQITAPENPEVLNGKAPFSRALKNKKYSFDIIKTIANDQLIEDEDMPKLKDTPNIKRDKMP